MLVVVPVVVDNWGRTVADKPNRVVEVETAVVVVVVVVVVVLVAEISILP